MRHVIPPQSVMRAPVVAGLGQAALAGGMSAYGNVAEENDRSKGDQRMILESALAALGAGIAASRMRDVMNRQSSPLAARIDAKLQARYPAARQSMSAAYKGNSLLRRIPPETMLGLAGTSAAAAWALEYLAAPLLPSRRINWGCCRCLAVGPREPMTGIGTGRFRRTKL